MLENTFISIKKKIPQVSCPEGEKGENKPPWKSVSWWMEDFRERVRKPEVHPARPKASLVSFQKKQERKCNSHIFLRCKDPKKT